MSEELGYVRVRMLISSMFEGLVSGNRMIDFYPAKRIIKYSRKFEVRDMGSGVILIKEPSVELMTDEDLVCMGFGC
ncbi:MAG: hypothetical protein EPN24_02430 [Candidatus Methanoperedens sp.]|nr:MAG: hypothetical protein EPN24_02430 [Candidatus Methanoperedens sp.]